MKRKVFLLIILVIFNLSSFCQVSLPDRQAGLDSLWVAWNDASNPDTSRLKAIHEYAIEGFLNTNPDSACYYAQLEYDFAKNKDLKYYMGEALYVFARSFYVLGDYEKAHSYCIKGLQITSEIGNKKGKATFLNRIGTIHRKYGDYDSAFYYYNLSIKIKEEINDKKGLAASLNNLGNVYNSMGDYKYALDYYTRSLKIREEIGDKAGIANSLNNIGVIHTNEIRNDSALYYYKKSLVLKEEIGDKVAIARTLNNIGNIYRWESEYDSALTYSYESLEIAEEIGSKERISRSLYNISEVFFDQGNYKQSIPFLKQAYSLAKEMNDILGLRDYSYALYDAYKGANRISEALNLYELHVIYKDSVFRIENQREVIRQEYVKQATADSIAFAAQEEIQQAKLKQTRIIVLALIIVLVLMLVITIVFFRGREKQKRLNTELNNTQAQLIQFEKMASLGQLAAGVAHEINNPISFISNTIHGIKLNLIDLLKIHDEFDSVNENNVLKKLTDIRKLKDNLDYQMIKDELIEQPDQIIEGVDRTASIVEGLRNFSRLDESEKQICTVCEGLESTIMLIKHQVPDEIIIKKEICELPEFECYPGKLNQVFLNILMNSLDALKEKLSKGGGLPENEIVVKSYAASRQSNNYIVIEISDTALGIPEDIEDKIFDPFFTTKEVGEGTGLGLSICYNIIEEHDGTIDVYSEINRGSKFVINLPVK